MPKSSVKTESKIKNQESSETNKKISHQRDNVGEMAEKKELKSKNQETLKKPSQSTKRENPLIVPMMTLKGQEEGTFHLPEAIFGQKVNKQLIAQAVRVYSTNMQGHYSHTKTRGEVVGSTKKVYRQKGTGGARHGSVMSPVYVGGGIALGPKPRKTTLDLPKKMKKAALISALSLRAQDQSITAAADLDKVSGKTKQMAVFLSRFAPFSILIVGDASLEKVSRSVRNVPGVNFTTADQMNIFEVIKYQNLIITSQAVEKLQERLSEEKKGEK